MKALVACEFSGRITHALRARGVEAFSCDLEPTEGLWPEFHFQCDVRLVLSLGWDLLVAHPPCTYLATSAIGPGRDVNALSQRSCDALDFVKLLWAAPVARIAIENPVSILSTVWAKPTQVVQPWMFGDPFTKTTWLWLKGLPPLVPTCVVDERPQFSYAMPERKSRRKDRSRTFVGIADAIANQWGTLLC